MHTAGKKNIFCNKIFGIFRATTILLIDAYPAMQKQHDLIIVFRVVKYYGDILCKCIHHVKLAPDAINKLKSVPNPNCNKEPCQIVAHGFLYIPKLIRT